MNPTKTMVELGKLLSATAPNDTARILTICIDVLTETRDNLKEKTEKQTNPHPYPSTKTTNQ